MKAKKGNWMVRVKCIVDKEVICENCTEEEARRCPWDYAIDEQELSQIDWEVKQVLKWKDHGGSVTI